MVVHLDLVVDAIGYGIPGKGGYAGSLNGIHCRGKQLRSQGINRYCPGFAPWTGCSRNIERPDTPEVVAIRQRFKRSAAGCVGCVVKGRGREVVIVVHLELIGDAILNAVPGEGWCVGIRRCS